jgi:hypothetical protein
LPSCGARSSLSVAKINRRLPYHDQFFALVIHSPCAKSTTSNYPPRFFILSMLFYEKAGFLAEIAYLENKQSTTFWNFTA